MIALKASNLAKLTEKHTMFVVQFDFFKPPRLRACFIMLLLFAFGSEM